MLDENNLFQRAASSAYASMAAFTAAANMYNSFYPNTANTHSDPVNYFGCTGEKIFTPLTMEICSGKFRYEERKIGFESSIQIGRYGFMATILFIGQ